MFKHWKKEHLRKLAEARKIGRVDEDIGEMIDFINSLDDYYTTSTCSGRITFITIPESGKKNESEFHFKKHEAVDGKQMFEHLLELSKNMSDDVQCSSVGKTPKADLRRATVWFRMEGLITHIGARTLEDANKMLSLARLAGLKKSTLFSAQRQIIVEVNTSERIDAIASDKGKVVIPKDYFMFIVKKANSKLKRVKQRNNLFFDILKQSF